MNDKKDLNKKLKAAEKEINDILKKHNLGIIYTLSFPIYKILPDEVKLALSILGKHGMKIIFTLEPKK